jgi:prophage regulatory protein
MPSKTELLSTAAQYVAPSIKADDKVPAPVNVSALETDVTVPPKTGPPGTARNILRWPDVHRLTGRSRTQAWRDIRAGKFPAPVKLGPNSVGWYEDEVAEHQRSLQRVGYAASQSPSPNKLPREDG